MSEALTSERERAVLAATPTGVYLDGQWRAARGGGTFDVDDPATERRLCSVADGGGDDALAALETACAAQDDWARTPPRERGEILRRAFELMTARTEDLALLLTLEMGKPLAESRAEIGYAAEFFRWFSEEAVRIGGRYSREPGGDGRLLTMRHPVGPCLLITPWNFPVAMGTRKIGPAIAAGCTMIVKPAQLTPLSMLALADVLAEAGLPPGVLAVVPSASASATVGPLLTDRRLRKVSFTGSTEIGRTLMEQSSQNLLRMSMELGGNAPFLVFDDADIDAAVAGAVVAKMRNMGESCIAANRFYVHGPVAEEFTAKLAAALGAMTVGRGTDDGVQVGPLIDAGARAKVAHLVDNAVDAGARVLGGDASLPDQGHFVAPAVLTSVPPNSDLLDDEIFGPVAPVLTFEHEAEAVAAANDTGYGLVAYVYTAGLDRALRVTEALESGMVGLNRGKVSNPAGPFGGVKQSGFGREGGAEGIEEYTATKYVAVELDD